MPPVSTASATAANPGYRDNALAGHLRRQDFADERQECGWRHDGLSGEVVLAACGTQRVEDHRPQVGVELAGRAGLDPVQFAGHSLRSGFLTLTSAAEAGASIWKMADQSRHRSLDTLRGYVRRADLFHEHAGAGFL